MATRWMQTISVDLMYPCRLEQVQLRSTCKVTVIVVDNLSTCRIIQITCRRQMPTAQGIEGNPLCPLRRSIWHIVDAVDVRNSSSSSSIRSRHLASTNSLFVGTLSNGKTVKLYVLSSLNSNCYPCRDTFWCWPKQLENTIISHQVRMEGQVGETSIKGQVGASISCTQ